MDNTRPYLRLTPDLLRRVDRYWHQRELPSRHAALIELLQAQLDAYEGDVALNVNGLEK